MFQRVPHYIAISKYSKVLCIELPLTIFDMVFRPRKVWAQRFKFKHRLRQVKKNIFVYTPITLIPFGLSYRNSFLGALNKFCISRQVIKPIRYLRITSYITIIHAPHQSCLVGILNPLIRVYEMTDERVATEQHPNLSKFNSSEKAIFQNELQILSKVDIVFVTARKLYERKHLYNKNTYFIPNGVDLDHFLSSNNKELPDIEAIPHPRIGYVGHINTFLDFEWLDFCAVKHPEWSFVFVGTFDNKKILYRDSDFVKFAKRKNVFMLGWKKYEDLPAYMNKMDVFLIPRKMCDYSENSNPNKIYQYASTGKPIVSSRFSSVEPFEGPVFLAEDKFTFNKQIERAVCENDSSQKEQRLEIARQNDLNIRAKEKIDIIDAYFAEKVK